jgi:hypothetical protein
MKRFHQCGAIQLASTHHDVVQCGVSGEWFRTIVSRQHCDSHFGEPSGNAFEQSVFGVSTTSNSAKVRQQCLWFGSQIEQLFERVARSDVRFAFEQSGDFRSHQLIAAEHNDDGFGHDDFLTMSQRMLQRGQSSDTPVDAFDGFAWLIVQMAKRLEAT